jgi:hypothetical protein
MEPLRLCGCLFFEIRFVPPTVRPSLKVRPATDVLNTVDDMSRSISPAGHDVRSTGSNDSLLRRLQTGGAPVSPPPEIASKHPDTNHNDEICHIENASMKRANADKDEVTDEAMPRETVNQVACPARPDQTETGKRQQTQSASKRKIHEQAQQPNPGADGKQSQP